MAGLGKKTFTAGEVLTAADVNGYLMEQSVMVFGGTAARSSAIPTPSEGMVTYRTDSDALEYYNGSAWNAVAPTPALTLIKTQTVGSGVSSVTVSDAFSTTYNKYKIVYSGGTGSGNLLIRLQLGSTTTGYYNNYIYSVFSGSGTASFTGNNNQAYFNLIGYAKTTYALAEFELINPFEAQRTFLNGYFVNTGSDAGPVTGYLDNTTSYTAFTLLTDTNTLSGGTIYVYGYQKA